MLPEAKQLVGIAVERLALARTLDDRPGEPLTHAHGLRVVKIAPAAACWPLIHERKDAVSLASVGTPVTPFREQACVENPAQDNESADLEDAGDAFQFACQIWPFRIHIAERIEGHKELRGNPVAPALDGIRWAGPDIRVRHGGLAKPDMGQLVSEREDLRSLRIRAVHEHQWRQLVDQSEPAKLLRIELPVRVAAND